MIDTEKIKYDLSSSSLADIFPDHIAAESEEGNLENKVAEENKKSEMLEAQIAVLEEQLQWLQTQLANITSSRSWRLALLLGSIRRVLLPPGGRLENFLRILYRNTKKHLRAARKRLKRVSFASSETVEVKGLVSVVLPIYNHAYLVRPSIESVLAQTYRNFELIIVDDGSSDEIEAVLLDYVDHPQVRILRQANQKLPKALSNGFQFARGEYWTWTSADNMMHPEQLQKLVSFLQAHRDAVMVYADYTVINEDGQPLRDPSFRPHNRRSPDDPEIHLPHNTEPLCNVADNFIGPCFLYRGWVGRLMGEYDPILGIEDYDYWMRINSAFRIMHLDSDKALYRYRVHDDSLSGRAVQLKIFEHARNLMVYQRKREEYYQRPWTIYADEAIYSWLKRTKTAPHQVIPWSGQQASCSSGEKKMLIVEASNLPTVAGNALPDDLCVVAVFNGDISAAYRYRNEIRRTRAVCFSKAKSTLQRLALLTPQAFQVESAKSLVELAVCYANNRIFYANTRSSQERARSAPRVFQSGRRRLHVLMQVDSFTQGGMENMVIDMATSLDRRYFQTSMLVLGRHGEAVSDARRRGIRVLTLPATNREEAYGNLLVKEKIDLVNTHFSLFGASITCKLGIPFVQTIHGTYVGIMPKQRAAYQANDRFTSAYACVSQAAAYYSDVNLGLSVAKMVVIPNGINTARLNKAMNADQREDLRRQLGLSPKNYVFLNAGSIQAPKGQLLLVKAFAEVFAEHPEARLVLLGKSEDAKYFAEIKRLITRRGLEKAVILAGHHNDVGLFYCLADAFVLPSLWEGWSLALAEAIYSNLPVIATAVGSAPDLLPEVGGRLIPPPFESITDLEYETLSGYLTRHDPQFLGNLIEVMKGICVERPRPELPDHLRREMDCKTAYHTYEQLYMWLVQGGDPSAARAWSGPFADLWTELNKIHQCAA